MNPLHWTREHYHAWVVMSLTGANRKSNPSILVVQSALDRAANNASSRLGGTRYGRILVQ